ncbi:MAG: hypothetical protein AB9858_02370 [Acidaminococcaceae bacterium]
MSSFDYIDWVLTILSAVGAYKSNAYYKKSKQLTIYASTNSARIETQNIINILAELLEFVGPPKKRGVSNSREVAKRGSNIKSSINKIRDSLQEQDLRKFNNILNSSSVNVDVYVDSLITGSICPEGNFSNDESYYACDKGFKDIQLFLKHNIENLEEKLK